MKIKIKTYLKLGILLFWGSFILVNCQKEDVSESITQAPSEAFDQSPYKISTIGTLEVQQNEALSSRLNALEGSLAAQRNNQSTNREVYSSTHDFYINTSVSKYVENQEGTYHSYTFSVRRPQDNGLMENLLVNLQEDGSYRLYLVSYDLTSEERSDLLQGMEVDFQNKYVVIEIENDGLTNNLFGRFAPVECNTVYLTHCGGSGNHSNGMLNGSPCPAFYIEIIVICSEAGGGDGDGGDGYGGGGTGNPNGEDDGTDTGDGTSGGGGGSGSGNSPDPTNPIVSTPVVLTMAQQLSEFVTLNDQQVIWANKQDQDTIDEITSFMLTNCEQGNNSEGCTQAKEFLLQAILAYMNGGEVDFEEKKINGIKLDDSLPSCLISTILDLMLGNFPYSDTMGNIDLINETFSELGGSYSTNPIGIVVTYKAGDISGNGETAGTGYDAATQTINISITISNNLINNGTKLAIAKTVLHESIHAYLLKIKFLYPDFFSSSNEFSQLALDYRDYVNNNDADHTYMSNIIANMSSNLSNFVQEKYNYPTSSSAYYQAVCWSGLTHLSNGSVNPLFSNNYPDSDDQNNIIKIFNTENGTASYPGYSPLIDNNCN